MRFSFITKVLMACAITHAAAQPTERVTVEAEWQFSSGPLKPSMVRQLIAWRKGEIRFAPLGPYRAGHISLTVRRVVEGRLAPDLQKNAQGHIQLRVIPLDDAAAGIRPPVSGAERPNGLWTLTLLPNGSYVVFDLKDTPLAEVATAAEQENFARTSEDLASEDPQINCSALRHFRNRCLPSLFPLVFEMVESDVVVSIPDGIHFDSPYGGGVAPMESTLSVQAIAALKSATKCLSRGLDMPADQKDPESWAVWWEQILAAEPFPKMVSETVQEQILLSLPMHQTWPEMFISPDARYAVISGTRFKSPINGVKNAIFLIDLSNRDLHEIHQVGRDAINGEQRALRVAWGVDAIGVIYKNPDWTTNKAFLITTDYDGRNQSKPRAIPLEGVKQWTLTAFDGGWVIAYVSHDGNAFAAQLDQDGILQGNPTKCEHEFGTRRPGFHDQIQNISATPTDHGLAIAFDGGKGAFLSLLDHELTLLSTVRIDDPAPPHYYRSRPRVAWNGRRILVNWMEESGDGSGESRLYARMFNEAGIPQCERILVTQEVANLAPPVPYKNGFALAWVDHLTTPDLVRAVRMSNTGEMGPITAVHHSIHVGLAAPGLGLEENTAHALVYDRTKYPYRFLLKSEILPPIDSKGVRQK